MKIAIISPGTTLAARLLDTTVESNTIINIVDCSSAGEQLRTTKPDIMVLEHINDQQEIFALCRNLKAEPDYHFTAVILSDNQEAAFWLEAYDAGVDAIIYKSAAEAILKLKFSNLVDSLAQRKSLKKDLSETQKIAMTAMSGSNELGQIIRFVQKSYGIHNFNDLAESLFIVTNGLGLNCCLMIKTAHREHVFSSDGEVKKLEQNIFALVEGEGRFFDFGCRTIISYPNIILLIKNMPIEDEERYGRLKDLLPALLDVIDAKVISLEMSMFIKSQAERLSASFDAIERSFQYISELARENLHEGTKKMQDMLHDLNNHLPRMGLEEDQETFILDRVEGAISDSRKMLDMSDEMEKIFAGIHDNLQSVVEQQNQLLLSMNPPDNENASVSGAANDTQADNVELF